MATFRCLKMLRGGWEFQEGTAVGFLLVWCGRSATTLVAAGHSQKTKKPKNQKTKKPKNQRAELDSGSKALPE
jgi:hypothetical protein